jgi:hypothetical protein
MSQIFMILIVALAPLGPARVKICSPCFVYSRVLTARFELAGLMSGALLRLFFAWVYVSVQERLEPRSLLPRAKALYLLA